jgi:hypothetical protein
MKRIVLLISLMILFSTISIFAQNLTTIYGNVGVENANIRVLNTQYGTSSDVKGNYSFSIKSDKDIKLLYSCIGYQDTTIMIRHKELKKDSVNISFEMRPVYYMLPEVGISGEKVIRYREEKYVMTDFEITNDRFYILQRRNGSLKDYRILLTDMMFNALDTIDIKLNTSVEMMFKDCMNNCHIITADSVYQIVEKGNEYTVAFPTERNKFINVMGNCLFVTDNWIYTKKIDKTGYNEIYYRVNLNDRKAETVFRNIDTKSHKNYAYEYNFHKEFIEFAGAAYSGPSPEEWGVFLKTAWLHPKSSYLGFYEDTLIYFNHVKSVIEMYDEDLNLLNSCDITYPKDEDFWRYTIYQDRVFNKFYTVFGETLNEIDVKTGKTYPKASVNQWTSQRVIVYKGAVYVLKRSMDSSNKWISYIDRIQL